MMNQLKSFTSLCKQVVRYAAPISATSLLNILASFIAMLFVARLGKVELAAGALATSTYYAIVTFGTCFMYAISILVGKFYGSKSHSGITKVSKNGLIVAMCLALISALILWHVNYFMLWLGLSPQLVARTIGFFHYAALCIFVFMLNMLMTQMLIGLGRPEISFFSTFVRLPCTIFLSYVLILGKFGFPVMGLAGVTASQFVVSSGYTLFLLLLINLSKRLRHYSFFSRGDWFDFSMCKRISKLGLPIGFQFSAEIVAMTAGTYLMESFGVTPLAASQIVSQYTLIPLMITLGFSQALAVLISRHDANIKDYKRYLLAGFLPLTMCFLVFIYCFVFQYTQLTDLFLRSHHPDNLGVAYYARYFFLIAAFFIVIDGLRNLLNGILRGFHNSKTPMLIGVSCLWFVALPVGFIVGFIFDGGAIGLRLGFVSGFILAVILLWMKLARSLFLGETPTSAR